MDLNVIIPLISSVGFPIIVAWYLLTKTIPELRKSLDSNTTVMRKIGETLSKICEHLNISEKDIEK